MAIETPTPNNQPISEATPESQSFEYGLDDLRAALHADPLAPSVVQEAEQNAPEPAPQPAAEAAPREAALPQSVPQDDIAALRAEIAQLRSQPQVQPQPAPAQTQESKGADDLAKMYGFQIPDQLYAQLESEDPGARRQALSTMFQGIAMLTHQNLRKELEQRTGEMREYVPQVIRQQQEAVQAAKQVHDDFYGTYPGLDRAELKPIVQTVGRQVAQELGIQQWTPTLRDAIAARLASALGQTADHYRQRAQTQVLAPAPADLSPQTQSQRPVPISSSDPSSLLRGLI